MKKYTQLNIRHKKFPVARKVEVFKMKVKKGDTVKVMTGKDKGKTGTVLQAFPMTNKVIVDGVSMHKRHTRSRLRGQSGTIVDRAMPIHASNVMVMDPKGDKPTRVKRVMKDGKRVRVTKSGTTLN